MRVIELTRGQVAIVDDEDYERFAQYRWCFMHAGYAMRRQKKAEGSNKVCILLHRAIVGAKKGESVDHINGNTLDNRRENLRICTHAENLRNQRLKKTSSSGLKGATLCKKTGKWCSKITKDGKTIHLGKFETAAEAHAAYCAASVSLHGEFARFN
jgi:hypothetical protein